MQSAIIWKGRNDQGRNDLGVDRTTIRIKQSTKQESKYARYKSFIQRDQTQDYSTKLNITTKQNMNVHSCKRVYIDDINIETDTDIGASANCDAEEND